MKTRPAILLLCALCCPALRLQAQVNLVPNQSFEDTVQCPTPNSQIQYATGWLNPNGYSPDYFNSCANSSNPNYGIPNNFYGFQNPMNGIAYAGIYLPVNSGNDLREYIQIQLSDTLVAGLEYIVKFYVSLADSSVFSVNSIGAYLSNNAINSPTNKVFNVTPQVVNNAISNPLINKTTWYKISDTITAIGGEEYITIGNFEFDNVADTTTVAGGGLSPSFASYYYIDDVSVEMNPISINEHSQSTISVYPNPSNGNIELSANQTIENYSVYSSLGQLMISDSSNTKNTQINLTNHAAGIYYINIQTKNSTIIQKLIIH